jgi:hypothetical protein
MKELVRYATLAPSGHNTQCWKFQVSENTVTVWPDLERATPVVDPDDHHVYVSLGCAVENLAIAGLAHGLQAQVDSTNPAANGIKVTFRPCTPQVTSLYESIPNRQVTRVEYNGEKLSDDELQQLQKTALDGTSGVTLLFLTDNESIKTAQDYIVRANSKQMQDASFRNELKDWVRFGDSDCLNKGDGLMGPAMGSPSMPRIMGSTLPRLVGSKIFDWTVTAESENRKIEKQIASSAGLAVIVSQVDDAEHWVEAGRVYERFALAATSLGIKNAFLNQPVEVAEVRPEFARAFGLEGRPDLIVRFGKGGTGLPHSLRRPVEDVIVE